MYDGELIGIQPRTSPVSLARQDDFLVVIDVGSGSRIRIHKDHIRALEDAIFDIKWSMNNNGDDDA